MRTMNYFVQAATAQRAQQRALRMARYLGYQVVGDTVIVPAVPDYPDAIKYNDSRDFSIMRQREHTRALYRDHYASCKEAQIDMALFFGIAL